MKYLVTTLCSVALLALICLTGPGCKTVSSQVVTGGVTNTVTTSQVDPVAASDALRVVTAAAIPFAVAKDTNCIPYLRGVSILLHSAANSGAYDPAALKVVLSTISVKEIRTPEAVAGVNSAFAIYQAYVGKAVNARLDQNQWVKPVLSALADGIEAGLPPL